MSEFRTFDKATRTPAVKMRAVQDPAGWLPGELEDVNTWSYRLSDADRSDLMNALRAFKAANLPIEKVDRRNFPLKTFDALLKDVHRELLDGRGIVMLKDFPIRELDIESVAIAYLGLGSYLGETAIQNKFGHVLGHVKDLGENYNDAGRSYNTSAEIRFHADACDYVGLLCLQTAKSGGTSRIASSVTVYNKLLERRPDLVEVLCQDFYRSHNGEVSPGEDPFFRQPIFSFEEGYFSAIGAGSTIEKAQRLPGVPLLTPQQAEAVRIYRETVSECAVDIPFAQGDIQFLNNHVMLHSRRAFEDWPEPERKRHLLRLWLRDPDGRPVPKAQRESRSGRGIQIEGLRPIAPLSATAAG